MLKAVIQKGWPEHKSDVPSIIFPYFNMRYEMSIQDGLVFKGERVVVPRASRSELLRRIHSSHLGVNGCLNRGRECLYWPGMTADIKNYVVDQRHLLRLMKGLFPKRLVSFYYVT